MSQDTTTGVGIAAVVTLSGSGVSHIKGSEYSVTLAKDNTLQLTAGLKDASGNVVTAAQNFTFISKNKATISKDCFSSSGSPAQSWNTDVVEVDSNGLVTAKNVGFGTVEVQYPFADNTLGVDAVSGNVVEHIYATLVVEVTAS